MRILLVKLSSLGDVVHAMAAAQDLRQMLPQASVDWVVERAFAPLLKRCQGLQRIVACDLRSWRKAPFAAATHQGWKAFKTELQECAYDAVIDLQGLSKSALVARLAQLAPGGKRYAMANQTEGSSFEAPTRWLADVAIKLPRRSHAVTRARLLCAQALGYQMPPALSFGLLPQATSSSLDASPNGTVALLHGASRADKCWPLDYWRALATRLNASGFGVALAHGNAAEKATCQFIAQGLEQVQIWPHLALDELTDKLAACVGAIGVDSGLSHIAMALNLPQVQIYNFDTAWRTGALATQKPSSAAQVHQVSVFAHPTPALESIWQAWQGVLSVNTLKQP